MINRVTGWAIKTRSVYPKHMETEARAEIERYGFIIQDDFAITLVHDRTDTVK